jgi:hypothetical protein
MEITLLGYDYYRYGWYEQFHVALTPELHASLVYYHNDVVQERLRKLSALVKYHKHPAFFAEYRLHRMAEQLLGNILDAIDKGA